MTRAAGFLALIVALAFVPGGAGSALGGDCEVVNILRAGTKRSVPEFHAFGGKELPMTIDLKGDEEAEIVLRVFQTADGLSAPLGPVQEAGRFSPDARGAGHLDVSLPLPKVDKPLRLAVQILTKKDEMLRGRCGFLVFVHPQEDTQLIAALEQARKRAGGDLAVFGEGEELRNYLRKHEVRFVEAGPGLPAELDPKLFYLGNTDAEALKEWSPRTTGPVAVIAFTNDRELLPGFTMNTAGAVTCGKVTLPILETLDSDPRSQKSLVAAIDQTVATIISP